MTRCLCTLAPNPHCPVDHELAAASLEDAVRERIAATPYSDLRDACVDFWYRRKDSLRWPHGYRFSAWYRDVIEREIDMERRLA